MKGRATARTVLSVIFVALLALPAVLRHFRTRGENANASLDANVALNRYGFHLSEVGRSVGVDFVHQAPVLDPKLKHIMPQVASMGAAVSIVDFDRDGWADIYVTNSGEGSKNALYPNLIDGSFNDVASELEIADLNQPGTRCSMAAVFGVFDNDGYEDLFLYKWGKPELFHNDCGHGFTRVTDKAKLPAWVNANTAILFDYD